MQGLDEVGVAARDQLVEQFDHRHLRPESVVDGRHLQADDPAADHEQPLGDLRQLQRAGRGEDPRVVGRSGDRSRLRARRDDAVVERDRPIADADRVRAGQRGDARDHLDLALLREAGEPAGQLLDDRGLPGPQLVQIHLGLAELDAVLGHLLGLGDDSRGMQQRLGRDAARRSGTRRRACRGARSAPSSARGRRPGTRPCTRPGPIRSRPPAHRGPRRSTTRVGEARVRARTRASEDSAGASEPESEGAAPFDSSVSSTLPSDTRSPILTRS